MPVYFSKPVNWGPGLISRMKGLPVSFSSIMSTPAISVRVNSLSFSAIRATPGRVERSNELPLPP